MSLLLSNPADQGNVLNSQELITDEFQDASKTTSHFLLICSLHLLHASLFQMRATEAQQTVDNLIVNQRCLPKSAH